MIAPPGCLRKFAAGGTVRVVIIARENQKIRISGIDLRQKITNGAESPIESGRKSDGRKNYQRQGNPPQVSGLLLWK